MTGTEQWVQTVANWASEDLAEGRDVMDIRQSILYFIPEDFSPQEELELESVYWSEVLGG